MTFIWRVHDSHVTTKGDGWYATRFIQRSGAGASRIGNEVDTLVNAALSKRLSARLGYFRFIPGPYVDKTGPSGSPYEVRLQIFGTF